MSHRRVLGFRLVALAALASAAALPIAGAPLVCPPDQEHRTERSAGIEFQMCFAGSDREGVLRAEHPGGARAVEGRVHGVRPIGVWSAWYASGQLAWRGELVLGKRDGEFTRGRFPRLWPERGPHKGSMEGRWEFWWENGTRRRVAHYRAGELEGVAEDWRPDGSRYQRLEFSQGRQHGKQQRWHATGQLASVEHWVDGKQSGPVETFYPSGKRRESWGSLDGKKHGAWKTWFESGQVHEEGRYENGRHVGEWRSFHENGARAGVIERSAIGKEEERRVWYSDGVLREHSRRSADGRRVTIGGNDNYDPRSPNSSNVTIAQMLEWERAARARAVPCPAGHHAVRDVEIGRHSFEGCVDAKQRKQGIWKSYYGANARQSERSFRDDVLDGPLRAWWEGGQLAFEGSYDDGVPTGEFRQWSWDGVQTLSGRFERGVPVGTWRDMHEYGQPEEEVELGSRGELIRWSRWSRIDLLGTVLVETGERVPSGAYRVRRFDRDGYPTLEIETPAERGGIPSRHAIDVFERPSVRVVMTGAAVERESHGSVSGRGRYQDGKRVGDWVFPLAGEEKSYTSPGPAARSDIFHPDRY